MLAKTWNLVYHREMERWIPVPNQNGYEVSSLGRVRSVDRTVPHPRSGQLTLRGRVLRANIAGNHRGYPTVHLGQNNTKTVHSLVALAFLGPPEGRQVRHLNGDPHDNRLENLAYGTVEDNMADMVRHGTQWQQQKTHCPAGHPLEEPNLVPSQARRGWRQCLACQRARNWVKNHPEADFQTEADRYHRTITGS